MWTADRMGGPGPMIPEFGLTGRYDPGCQANDPDLAASYPCIYATADRSGDESRPIYDGEGKERGRARLLFLPRTYQAGNPGITAVRISWYGTRTAAR